MIGRTNACSSGGGYSFTYNANDGELNGEPITTGQTVQLSAGSYNVLYTYSETCYLEMVDGPSVPYNTSNPEPSSLRAGGNVAKFLHFVMPAQSVTFT